MPRGEFGQDVTGPVSAASREAEVARAVRGSLRGSRFDLPRRVAVLSLHTSPLDQPGVGDAGGMNVYVVETSKRLAALGIEVDIFTRATSSDRPPAVELVPRVQVRHIVAGPFELSRLLPNLRRRGVGAARETQPHAQVL